MKITKTQISEEIDGYITVLEPENGETTVTRGVINYAVTTKIAQYGKVYRTDDNEPKIKA